MLVHGDEKKLKSDVSLHCALTELLSKKSTLKILTILLTPVLSGVCAKYDRRPKPAFNAAIFDSSGLWRICAASAATVGAART